MEYTTSRALSFSVKLGIFTLNIWHKSGARVNTFATTNLLEYDDGYGFYHFK
jgi:hypothetical protein